VTFFDKVENVIDYLRGNRLSANQAVPPELLAGSKTRAYSYYSTIGRSRIQREARPHALEPSCPGGIALLDLDSWRRSGLLYAQDGVKRASCSDALHPLEPGIFE
jgi:hypothetical protein